MSSDALYIHGHGSDEQDRLIRQAATLEPFLHRNLRFDSGSRVLEIGCGVGAQLRIMASRHPRARFWGVDVSDERIAGARLHLKSQIASGQVSVTKGDGNQLPFPGGMFDSVVIFFVLEHVAEPVRVIHEAHRVLRTGGILVVTEVVNSSLLACPESERIADYWKIFNRYQRDLGGDPDVGIKLGGLLLRAGFRDIELNDASVILDERTQDAATRKAIVDNWLSVFLSASARLIAGGLVDGRIDDVLRAEFTHYLHDRQSVFAYPARQARGRKGRSDDTEERCCT